MVGDWIADWDFTYGAWFYYNTKTGGLLELHFIFTSPISREIHLGAATRNESHQV